jgi:hypothetical protein
MRMMIGHRVNFSQLIARALAQQRRMRLRNRHAAIDDPGPWLAVVGAGCIEQQERMPGGRRVHHDELPARLADGA